MAAGLVAALVALLVGLARATGLWSSVAFGLPLVVTSALFTVFASVPHALSWTVILGTGAVMMRLGRRGVFFIAAAALLGGSLFAYVDLLTTPPSAFMVVLIGVLALSWAPLQALKLMSVAGLCWVWGYLGTWIAKWAVSGAILGFGTVRDNVLKTIFFRLDGQWAGVETGLGAATRANLRTWLDLFDLVRPLVALWIAFVVVGAVVVAVKYPSRAAWLLLYAAVAVTPFIWYELVSNHSQIHAWFTFRSLSVSLAALTTGVATLLAGPDESGAGPDPTPEDSEPHADRVESETIV